MLCCPLRNQTYGLVGCPEVVSDRHWQKGKRQQGFCVSPFIVSIWTSLSRQFYLIIQALGPRHDFRDVGSSIAVSIVQSHAVAPLIPNFTSQSGSTKNAW